MRILIAKQIRKAERAKDIANPNNIKNVLECDV